MPIYFSETFENAKIVIWKIQEEEEFFWAGSNLKLSPEDASRIKGYTNAYKRVESLAGRHCASMASGMQVNFQCYENDPPQADKGYLSIAHTKGYAGAIYHPFVKVGIDIELITRPVRERTFWRFASEDEMKTGTENYNRLVLWCAKEAIYKAGHLKGLNFKEHIKVKWITETQGMGIISFKDLVKIFALRNVLIENHLICVLCIENSYM